MKEFFYGCCVLAYAGLSFYLAVTGKAAELAGFAVTGALSLVFLKLNSFGCGSFKTTDDGEKSIRYE